MGGFVAILGLVQIGMTALMLVVLICVVFRFSALMDQCNSSDAEP